MIKIKNVLSTIAALLIAITPKTVKATTVFSQDFNSSSSLSSYISATPSTGQFNDISAEGSGGTWSINGSSQLQIVRVGNSTATNGAGITRTTTFGGPTVLTYKFDMGVTANAWQGGALTIEVGSFSSVVDYDTWTPDASVFGRINIDLTGSNTFKFNVGGTQSAAYSSNGTMYTVSMFFNKSGSTQTYSAPDGSSKGLNTGKMALWAGTTVLFDNVAALAGSTSSLNNIKTRFSTGDSGTWKFDNFLITDSFGGGGGGDTTAPVATISSPTTASTFSTTLSSVTLSGTASDNVGVTSVTWTNSAGGSGTASGTTAWSAGSVSLSPGTNVLTITARDAANNTSTATLTVTYTVPDSTPPVVTISSPTTSSTYTTTLTSVTLSGSASDNVGVASITWTNTLSSGATTSGTASGTTSWSTGGISLGGGTNVVTIKASDAAGNTATKTLTVTCNAAIKITLTTSMIINEAAIGSAASLVDEQTASGDPVNSTGGSPTTSFCTPYGQGSPSWYYPLNAIIDLGTTYHLTNICLYDANGMGGVTFSSGTPFSWTSIFTDGLTGYNVWQKHTVSVDTRYIQVSMTTNSGAMTEVLLYGYPLGIPAAPPTPATQTQPTIDQFMGVNTFFSEPLYRQQAVGFLREYHDWEWTEGHTSATYSGYPNNQNAFTPASWIGNGDGFDVPYTNMQTVGLINSVCIQNSPLWIVSNSSLLNNKPIPTGSGRNAVLPASYVEHADHMFQYAARYGSTTVSTSLIKVRSDNSPLTGLNLLHYFENWNEPDKYWEGRDGYFSPYEYAAMSSADADGHLGAMGSTFGIRNADPNAALVMAGIIGFNLDYIKAIKLWSDWNRGGDFPWDVINFHHYSNTAGAQMSGTAGISPEDDHVYEQALAIRQYRDTYLPGVEFWVSEFGYDINQSSSQHAPPIASFSAEEVQAQWILRTYLAYSAAGVDRAIIYTLADGAPVTSTGLYMTSGLVTCGSDHYTARASWYYVYTMKNRLSGLRFLAQQSSGNANVKIYQYADNTGKIRAYVLWCPTSNGTTVNGYSLALQGSYSTADLVTLQSGYVDGVKSSLTITSGAVSVNVSETPVFVMIDNTAPDFNITSKLTLTTSMVTNEAGTGNAGQIVDEQSIAGDPRSGNGGTPTTVWSPTGTGTKSAYIDLGQSYNIDQIWIFDANDISNLTVQIGTPGSWTTLFVDPLSHYQTWNQHVVNINTRYIRFTRSNGSANFGEVVIYGK